MKSFIAPFAATALLLAASSVPAQVHIRPPDKLGHLTLLPGPQLLSPAVGAAVPGSTAIVSHGNFTFRALSAPAPAARGTLTLGTSADPLRHIAPPKSAPYRPVDPASLRFDATLPKTEIRPLQKQTVPAVASPRSK
ncbi:MAG: hypothetical protein HZA93_00400 [Verrucomicrobia bacterium]|nr:hypothetical protein [Verrucomicrobiota bacterium]